MARQRATAITAGMGRRTGVNLTTASQQPLSQEPEDMTAFFDGAQENVGINQQQVVRNKPKHKNHKKKIRFSLDNHPKDEGTAVAAVAKPTTLRHKLTTARNSLSPSEVSRVSTAPPSATRTDVEEIEQTRHAATDFTSNAPTPMAAQTQDDMPETLDSPMAMADDDDDDDILPPPPDSPQHEDPPEEEEEVPTQMGESPVDFPTQVDDFENDDDKEGDGFEMADDAPDTADSPLQDDTMDDDDEESVVQETRKLSKKKKKKSKKRSAPDSDDDDDSDASVKKPKKSRKKKTQTRHTVFSPKGHQSGPLTYTSVPVTDTKDTPENGLRRSKRTHMKPLAWWKGERAEYGPNHFPEEMVRNGLENMSTVKAYLMAEPTPYKPRKVVKQKKKSKSKKQYQEAAAPDEEESIYDTSAIRKKYNVMEDNTAYLFDSMEDQADDMVVIGFQDEMTFTQLPIAGKRKSSESKSAGSAAQAFHTPSGHQIYPGYVMGSLRFPPTAIKDAESVGSATQAFTVVSCQENALEIAYSHPDEDNNGNFHPKTAQRFFLKSGDMFRIPPGNCYRIQNHSSRKEALLTWIIVKANPFPEDDDDEEEE